MSAHVFIATLEIPSLFPVPTLLFSSWKLLLIHLLETTPGSVASFSVLNPSCSLNSDFLFNISLLTYFLTSTRDTWPSDQFSLTSCLLAPEDEDFRQCSFLPSSSVHEATSKDIDGRGQPNVSPLLTVT